MKSRMMHRYAVRYSRLDEASNPIRRELEEVSK